MRLVEIIFRVFFLMDIFERRVIIVLMMLRMLFVSRIENGRVVKEFDVRK